MRAMILAAGRGQRLRPLTDGCPKPLIKVNQKPLIVYHIEALQRAGIEDIVINTCHLGAQIEQTLGDGSRFGVRLYYSPETAPGLETAGGIKNALPLLGTDPFIVVNADIFCSFDFSTLTAPTKEAHLVLVANPSHNPSGDFGLDGQELTRLQAGLTSYTYSGIACFRPEFFADMQSKRLPLPPLFSLGLLNKTITAETFSGFWTDVGNIERLQQLEQTLQAQQSQEKVVNR